LAAPKVTRLPDDLNHLLDTVDVERQRLARETRVARRAHDLAAFDQPSRDWFGP
jgi:hypothetical protein